MTDKQTPPDWILIEAAKRSGWGEGLTAADLGNLYRNPSAKGYHALCDMIERYEQPPVDRKLLCAREAAQEYLAGSSALPVEWNGLRAIELWESGYGA